MGQCTENRRTDLALLFITRIIKALYVYKAFIRKHLLQELLLFGKIL